jgi:hypothetical protein
MNKLNLKLSFILFFYFPQNVFGCPVCGFGQDGSQEAYKNTAILLTVMPFVIFGGLGLFFYYKRKVFLRNKSCSN